MDDEATNEMESPEPGRADEAPRVIERRVLTRLFPNLNPRVVADVLGLELSEGKETTNDDH